MRISNELGAHHPRTALFSLVVAVITSIMIGLFLAFVLMVTRDVYPSLFSNDIEVQNLVKELTPLLSFCIVINNVQPVLSGNMCSNTEPSIFLSIIACLTFSIFCRSCHWSRVASFCCLCKHRMLLPFRNPSWSRVGL